MLSECEILSGVKLTPPFPYHNLRDINDRLIRYQLRIKGLGFELGPLCYKRNPINIAVLREVDA